MQTLALSHAVATAFVDGVILLSHRCRDWLRESADTFSVATTN